MSNISLNVERWRKRMGKGERIRLPLQSEDMEPIVKSGDVLEFSEATLMELRAGDLVLLYNNGNVRLRFLAKRSISSAGEVFHLTAFNAPNAAGDYGFEDILAKVESLERDKILLWKRGEAMWRARWRRFWNRKKLS